MFSPCFAACVELCFVLGRQFAKILYIDHGNKSWVAADRLLVLPSLFYHYLWQASRCRLFGVQWKTIFGSLSEHFFLCLFSSSLTFKVEPVSDSWSFDVVIKFREFCEFNDLFLYSMDSKPPRHHCYTVINESVLVFFHFFK